MPNVLTPHVTPLPPGYTEANVTETMTFDDIANDNDDDDGRAWQHKALTGSCCKWCIPNDAK